MTLVPKISYNRSPGNKSPGIFFAVVWGRVILIMYMGSHFHDVFHGVVPDSYQNGITKLSGFCG